MICLIVLFTALIILFFVTAFSSSHYVMSSNLNPTANLSQDQVLSCYISTKPLTKWSVTWTKSGEEGVVYQYTNDVPQLGNQNPTFKGRTELLPDAAETGNFSLRIRNVQRSDGGDYTCSVRSLEWEERVVVHLQTAESLLDVLSSDQMPVAQENLTHVLSCYLLNQTATNLSVTWTKVGVDGVVYKYSNGSPSLENQNPQFKGRTEIFPRALVAGNASLQISKVRRSDEGEYTCGINSSEGAGKVNIQLRTAVKMCPGGWLMFGSSCYNLSTTPDSWDNARKACQISGADLVIINSLAEQQYLCTISKDLRWIGLSDRDSESNWKWVDGSSLTLKFWQYSQPDNGKGLPKYGEEDCAVLYPSWFKKSWNDLHCGALVRWICEKTAWVLNEN